MKSVTGPNMIVEHMIHYFHLKTYLFISNCTSSCQWWSSVDSILF